MQSTEEELKAAFPYPPYDIQQQFMINVFQALEQKQIGLLESPTGTGKTLSVICSTLHWLEAERDRQQKAAAEAALQDAPEGLPDWLAAAPQAASTPVPTQLHNKPQPRRKPGRKARAAVLDEEGNDISEFLPEGAAQQGAAANAASPGSKRAAPDPGGYVSSSSSSEDEPAAAGAEEDDVAAAAVERRQPQVIFCSRTHSQLSQFVGELHRTRFGSSTLLVAVASRKALCVNEEVRRSSELSQINERCLDLQRNRAAASSSSSKRKSTQQPGAAGSTVVGLSGAQRQQRRPRSSSGGKSAGCPYLSVEGGAAGWDGFRDLVLGSAMDVEELASLGRKMKVCPYYGSRRAVPGADVVLAPYSAVLMPDARASLGIELQDSVLVFDEAHNLLDAINSAHSTCVTAWQLLSVQRSLTAYYERFKAVLNPTNAQNIQRLLHIAAALHKCCQQPQQQHHQQQQSQLAGVAHNSQAGASSSSSSSASRVMAVNDLLFELDLDNINFFELAAWVKDNKMAFKVSGYTAAAVAKAGGSIQLQQPGSTPPSAAGGSEDPTAPQQQQQQQQQSLGQLSARDGVSAIHSFIAFLLSLTHADADGRIIIEPAAAAVAGPAAAAGSGRKDAQAARGGQLRYVLLNAARHFGKLLSSARSVLLVSGTLAPIEGLQAQLFPDTPPERVRHFECGHVVPPAQLLAVSIGRGPSGRALSLKHEARGYADVVSELGQVLVNLAGVVPEGLVVFTPSFGYLEQLREGWRASGVWDRLAARKQVFSEPRAATEVEAVLAAYAAAISGSTAAPTATDSSTAAHATPASATAAAGTSCAAGSAQASSGSGGRGVAGALMLCVVGGKLSEGINFGDGLGRCVVVVGLPYPNSTDVELQSRMQYLDRLAAQPAGRPSQAAAAAADPPQQQPTASQPSVDQQQQQQQQREGQLATDPPARRSAFQVLNQGGGRPPVSAPHPAAPGFGTPAKQLQASDAGAAEGAVVHQQQVSPAGGPSASHIAGATGTQPAAPAPAPAATASSSSGRLITGRDYYEDLCFKAVNQCVGRVVRHKGDHAAVVLLDTRWVAGPAEWAALSSSSSGSSRRKVPVQKLPGWLQRSYVPTNGDFGPALKQLAAFYKRQAQPPAEGQQ